MKHNLGNVGLDFNFMGNGKLFHILRMGMTASLPLMEDEKARLEVEK